jgi:hypothetical protein
MELGLALQSGPELPIFGLILGWLLITRWRSLAGAHSHLRILRKIDRR